VLIAKLLDILRQMAGVSRKEIENFVQIFAYSFFNFLPACATFPSCF
jgi:hypothetical protein